MRDTLTDGTRTETTGGVNRTIADVLEGWERWCVELGDCLEVLRTMPDESVDAVVCDPPAGIFFMGRAWDGDKGGRNHWIAWLAQIMTECRRVMKPGAHAVVWALPRTSHWTGMAIEDAGFQIRECVAHMFGSGFPKSLDVSKAIDAVAGAEREVVGIHTRHGGGSAVSGSMSGPLGTASELPLTQPATIAARQWSGWGTALKPSYEFWWISRKPLRGTVAANVCEFGTGAINVEACRVGSGPDHHELSVTQGINTAQTSWDPRSQSRKFAPSSGRWPPNAVFSHSADCERVGTREVKSGTGGPSGGGGAAYRAAAPVTNHKDSNGRESVLAYRCAPGCPVAALDAQAGDRPSGIAVTRHGGGRRIFNQANTDAALVPDSGYSDNGGPSRFFPCFEWTDEDWWPLFYCAKASRAEREAGCDGLAGVSREDVTGRKPESAGQKHARSEMTRTGLITNNHPTVKPIELMRWLCRLVTPPGGLILDPFAGSGTTLCAAGIEGFRAIGIERETEYADIARARCRHFLGGDWKPAAQAEMGAQPATETRRQMELF